MTTYTAIIRWAALTRFVIASAAKQSSVAAVDCRVASGSSQ